MTKEQIKLYLLDKENIISRINNNYDFFQLPKEEVEVFELLSIEIYKTLSFDQLIETFFSNYYDWCITLCALESIEEFELCAKVKFIMDKEEKELNDTIKKNFEIENTESLNKLIEDSKNKIQDKVWSSN